MSAVVGHIVPFDHLRHARKKKYWEKDKWQLLPFFSNCHILVKMLWSLYPSGDGWNMGKSIQGRNLEVCYITLFKLDNFVLQFFHSCMMPESQRQVAILSHNLLCLGQGRRHACLAKSHWYDDSSRAWFQSTPEYCDSTQKQVIKWTLAKLPIHDLIGIELSSPPPQSWQHLLIYLPRLSCECEQ